MKISSTCRPLGGPFQGVGLASKSRRVLKRAVVSLIAASALAVGIPGSSAYAQSQGSEVGCLGSKAATLPGVNLSSGQTLSPGQSLNGKTKILVMQTDGNLVLYLKGTNGQPAVPVWASNTWGNWGARAVMQSDGNLVVYRAGGSSPADALWSTGTYNHWWAHLELADNGDLAVYGSQPGLPLWNTNSWEWPASWYVMQNGLGLTPGQSIESATVWLIMQYDGNLVIYRKRDGAVLWASGTNGHPCHDITMQSDGNLVEYGMGFGATWATGTWGNQGAFARLQDDGNFVIYRKGGGTPDTALWSTGTWRNSR